MIDIADLLNKTNCTEVIRADLGDSHNNTWPCPFHGETHGRSLAAWKDGWRCFGKCDDHGDVIDWVMKYRRVEFKEACQQLGVVNTTVISHPVGPVETPKPPTVPPLESWQERAFAIMRMTEATLWSERGEKARAYLHNRGLGDDIITDAHLGYLPGYFTQWIEIEDVKVPCGITIPWLIEENIWALKVRRAAGDAKYQQIAGGNLSGALYWADQLRPGRSMFILEGEFDTLIAAQEAGDLVNPVTAGSASNSINSRWFGYMACCPEHYACYDADDAGDRARERIASMKRMNERIKLIKVPQGKDLTDLHLQGDRGAVRAWIKQFVGPIEESEPEPAAKPHTQRMDTVQHLTLSFLREHGAWN